MFDRGEDGEGDPGSISWLIKIWNILVLGSGKERNIKWQEDGGIFGNSTSFRDYMERLNA